MLVPIILWRDGRRRFDGRREFRHYSVSCKRRLISDPNFNFRQNVHADGYKSAGYRGFDDMRGNTNPRHDYPDCAGESDHRARPTYVHCNGYRRFDQWVNVDRIHRNL